MSPMAAWRHRHFTQPDAEDPDALSIAWMERYFALRRRRLVLPLLYSINEGAAWFVATNPLRLYDEPELVTAAALKARIKEIESRDIERIPPQSEKGQAYERSAAV